MYHAYNARLGSRIQYLAHVECLSMREIASELRATPESVAKHLHQFETVRGSAEYARTIERIQERLNRAGTE